LIFFSSKEEEVFFLSAQKGEKIGVKKAESVKFNHLNLLHRRKKNIGVQNL